MRILSYFFIAILMLSVTQSFAQDAKAKEILDELSNKTRKYNTITSDFTFTLDDQAADVHQTQQGQLTMKGKKYVIKLGDNQIYSDGQTRWTYNADMNEVYIDNSEGGDDSMNPSQIYTIWETGFKQYYDQEVKENGAIYDVIKLNPLKPDEKAFHTVKLFVDRNKMQVGRIAIMGKQGDNYTYEVKSFKTDIPYGDDVFIFSKAKYPGVESIDNR